MKLNDKLLHFTACLAVTIALKYAFNTNTAVSFTAGLGIGKEVGDYMNYGRTMPLGKFLSLSVPDLVADSIGIAIGTIL